MKWVRIKTSSLRGYKFWTIQEMGNFTVTISWNEQTGYNIHKNPPVIHILSQINVIYISWNNFFNLHPNIILLYLLCPKWPLHFRVVRPKYLRHFLSLPCVLHGPPMTFDHCNHIWWRIQLPPTHVSSSLLGPNIRITLFSNTVSLHSYLNVKGTVTDGVNEVGSET